MNSSTPLQREAALAETNRDQPSRQGAPCAHVAIDADCIECGYNLRGQPHDARCPECGSAVAHSVRSDGGDVTASRVDRKWALLVVVGLVILLGLCPGQIWVDLQMSFPDAAFGSAPRLNIPGPKVWAVPMLQRSVGYRPESLGVQGTWLTLLGLSAVNFITTPRGRRADRSVNEFAVRQFTRWLPAVLTGGYLGFLMNAEGLSTADIAFPKYALIGVAGVELPCTALLLVYLGRVAASAGQSSLQKQFVRAACAAAAVQAGGAGMMYLAKGLTYDRGNFVIQGWSALYSAAAVIVGLWITGNIARLIVELAGVIAPRLIRDRMR